MLFSNTLARVNEMSYKNMQKDAKLIYKNDS